MWGKESRGQEPGSGPSSDLIFCVTLDGYLPFSEAQLPQMSKAGGGGAYTYQSTDPLGLLPLWDEQRLWWPVQTLALRRNRNLGSQGKSSSFVFFPIFLSHKLKAETCWGKWFISL